MHTPFNASLHKFRCTKYTLATQTPQSHRIAAVPIHLQYNLDMPRAPTNCRCSRASSRLLSRARWNTPGMPPSPAPPPATCHRTARPSQHLPQRPPDRQPASPHPSAAPCATRSPPLTCSPPAGINAYWRAHSRSTCIDLCTSTANERHLASRHTCNVVSHSTLMSTRQSWVVIDNWLGHYH